MITMALLNQLANLIDQFFSTVFSGPYQALVNLSQYVSAIQVPVTLLDTWGLVIYFLPMGTVITIGVCVVAMLGFQLVVGVVHWILHGFGIL